MKKLEYEKFIRQRFIDEYLSLKENDIYETLFCEKCKCVVAYTKNYNGLKVLKNVKEERFPYKHLLCNVCSLSRFIVADCEDFHIKIISKNHPYIILTPHVTADQKQRDILALEVVFNWYEYPDDNQYFIKLIKEPHPLYFKEYIRYNKQQINDMTKSVLKIQSFISGI